MARETGKRRPRSPEEQEDSENESSLSLAKKIYQLFKAEVAGFQGWKCGDLGIEKNKQDVRAHAFSVIGFDQERQLLRVRFYNFRNPAKPFGSSCTDGWVKPEECRKLSQGEVQELELD